MTPIQEYREWLLMRGLQMKPITATEALEKLNALFPEDTQTLSDHLDKIPGMHEESTVEKVQVIYKVVYRDGGTKLYEDRNGNTYYQDNVGYAQKGKIFAKHPHKNTEPPLNVELEIVDKFTDQPDETDNIYPKTQPHSFPPRD